MRSEQPLKLSLVEKWKTRHRTSKKGETVFWQKHLYNYEFWLDLTNGSETYFIANKAKKKCHVTLPGYAKIVPMSAVWMNISMATFPPKDSNAVINSP